jgi:hypothetical protein
MLLAVQSTIVNMGHYFDLLYQALKCIYVVSSHSLDSDVDLRGRLVSCYILSFYNFAKIAVTC